MLITEGKSQERVVGFDEDMAQPADIPAADQGSSRHLVHHVKTACQQSRPQTLVFCSVDMNLLGHRDMHV